MKQKTIDTINELVRRERLNNEHAPITDTDIREMVKDIKKTESNRLGWMGSFVILLVAYILLALNGE